MPRKRTSTQEPEEKQVHVPFEDGDPTIGEISIAELDEFIVPGSDDKGRKVTITLNIPPLLDRQLDVIMGSRRYPYANKKEIFRHAIFRHTSWLLDIRASVPRHFQTMVEAISEIVRDDESAMKMEQVFLSLEDRISDHIQRGEHMEAIRLVSAVNQRVRGMPPSVWVLRFTERFRIKYGDMLRSTDSKKSKPHAVNS